MAERPFPLDFATLAPDARPRRWLVLPEGFDDWRRDILCDPQTSGGLLIALAPETVPQVMARLAELGATAAAVVGRIVEGPPGVRVV